MARELVLASGSPRRRELLSSLGLSFEVDPADVDEREYPGEAPEELVIRLSRGKAEAVAARHRQAVVLAADTVVVLDGAILGKPNDPADARRMLEALRGRVHQVYTAVTVAEDNTLATHLSPSDVWMRAYDDDEIRAYVATGDPLDKAGAYAIQHPAFSPVDRCAGSFTSIMGLPLKVTAGMLEQAGITVPVDVDAVCRRWSNERCAGDAD